MAKRAHCPSRIFFFSSRRRHTRLQGDWSSDVCSSDLQIRARVEATVAGARLEIIPNDSPSAQRSVLMDNEHALAVSNFLRDDVQLRLDYASNVTGVDWPDP